MTNDEAIAALEALSARAQAEREPERLLGTAETRRLMGLGFYAHIPITPVRTEPERAYRRIDIQTYLDTRGK